MESGYYPMGAENDPRAPWNEVENPETSRECEACFELRRTLELTTRSYSIFPLDGEDTSDVDWKEEYESQRYTPVELIEGLADIVRRYCVGLSRKDKARVRMMLRDAEGWETEDWSVEEV